VSPGWQLPSGAEQVVALPGQSGLLAGEKSGIVALNADNAHVLREWNDPRRKRVHDGQLHSLQASPDFRWLLSSANEGYKLWDLSSGELAASIANTENGRASAAFHPHRAELALTREDRLEVWRIDGDDIWTRRISQELPIIQMDLSGDGRTLAATTVSDWEDPQRRLERIFMADLSQPTDRTVRTGDCDPRCLAISSHSRWLAINVSKGENLLLVDGENTGPARFVCRDLESLPVPVFSPDERRLWYLGMNPAQRDAGNPALGRQDQGFIAAVRTDDLHEEFRWVNERSARALNKSELLSLAVGETRVAFSSIDRTVRLLNAADGTLLWEADSQPGIVDSLCLSRDEQGVICGTRSGNLVVLTAAGGHATALAAAHDETVTTVTSAASGLIISGSSDGWLKAWLCRAGGLSEVFQFGPLSGPIARTVLSRDGSLLAVLVENESCVRLLDVRRLRQRLAELELDWQ
jgi:WD40 repeat protein